MIKLIALIYGVFGLYSFYAVIVTQHYAAFIGTTLVFVAAFGLWFRKKWSQYLVYLLSVGGSMEWLWLAWRASQKNNVFALIPGICLLCFFTGSSILVFRFFRSKS